LHRTVAKDVVVAIQYLSGTLFNPYQQLGLHRVHAHIALEMGGVVISPGHMLEASSMESALKRFLPIESV
jgi:hypothetical protein